MMNPDDLYFIVKTSLEKMDKELPGKRWGTRAAIRQTFYTAAAESNLQQLRQRKRGGGIAHHGYGIFQVEHATAESRLIHYILPRKELTAAIEKICHIESLQAFVPQEGDTPEQIEAAGQRLRWALLTKMDFGSIIARSKYRATPDPMPRAEDHSTSDALFIAMGDYWKEHYNSGGAAETARFLQVARRVKNKMKGE